MEGKDERKSLFAFIDRIKGDKVILVIAVCLILISIVAIFSATSIDPDVKQGKCDRVDKFLEQMLGVGGAIALIFVCYIIPSVRTYRLCSQLGFVISVAAFAILIFHIEIPGIVRTVSQNSATRTIKVFNLIPVNVVELSKVFMVLYLGWAVHAWKNDTFMIANKLSQKNHLEFLAYPFVQGVIYILVPIVIICLMTQPGGTSSMLFSGAVMFATILIGGFSIRDSIIYVVVGVTIFAGGYSLYKSSDGKVLTSLYSRLEKTGGHRIDTFLNSSDSLIISQMKAVTGDQRRRIRDDNKQVIGSKIAIHEGKLFGKWPGNSTQKYFTPLAFSDFMFSFLVEEYGLIGAVFLILLYVSLLARGSLIAIHCENLYARTVVGGLSILITGQAFMHMLINVGLMPVTGQTLPMISDGRSSLFMFSIAFGVLLSISKMVKDKIEKEDKMAHRIWDNNVDDSVGSTLDDLDDFDSQDFYANDEEESNQSDY